MTYAIYAYLLGMPVFLAVMYYAASKAGRMTADDMRGWAWVFLLVWPIAVCAMAADFILIRVFGRSKYDD